MRFQYVPVAAREGSDGGMSPKLRMFFLLLYGLDQDTDLMNVSRFELMENVHEFIVVVECCESFSEVCSHGSHVSNAFASL